MSETSSLTGPLLKAYEEAGCLAFRMQSGKLRKGSYWITLCGKGTADILLFPRCGGVVWVETKTLDGKTNREQIDAQAAFKERVEAPGHRYITATSIDAGLAALGR